MLPLEREHVLAIERRLLLDGHHRDYALFRLAIDSMLRASDIVRVMVDEVSLDGGKTVLSEAQVRMKKTGRLVNFPISPKTQNAIASWMAQREKTSQWLFPGMHEWNHLTEAQYRHRAKNWFQSIGLRPLRSYSTHSLRRTKATIMYDETKNVKAVAEMLGHRDLRVTEKYLGMTRAKAVAAAAKIDV